MNRSGTRTRQTPKRKTMQWQDELVKLIELENLAKQIPTTRGYYLAYEIHDAIVSLAKSV